MTIADSTPKAEPSRADARDFDALADAHRDSIRTHCYRMLGSIHEAEDATQDALLKAWRAWERFDGRSSFATWMFRIATNACLDRLRGTTRRAIPADLVDVCQPGLTPVPSRLLAEPAHVGPEARYDSMEASRLAFVAAVQRLTPRQRACVLLKDVIGWSVADIADCLATTPAAVNSTLQRARATLATRVDPAPLDRDTRRVIGAWLDLWATDHMQGLGVSLAADALFAQSPDPRVDEGRERVLAALFESACAGPLGVYRIAAAEFNDQPGFAVYAPDGEGTHYAYGVMVLDIVNGVVERILGFRDASLVALAGLPDKRTFD